MSDRRTNAILLGVVVLLALAIRLLCFTGPIGSDDSHYYIGAYEISEGTYQPGDNYWRLRYGMLLPIAASYKLFGAGEFTGVLWVLFCAIGAVVLCFFLGKLFLDEKTGLLAGLLLAFYPLDVHYSGVVLPDVPLSFLMAASVLAFLYGCKNEKYALPLFFLSGMLLAAAYTCRSMALILLPFYFFYWALFERKLKPGYLLLGLGFLSIIGAESLYYTLEGLGPLHNFEINAKATQFVNASGECSTSQAYYPSSIFRDFRIFGPYFFLFIPAMVFSLVKRERGALVFLVWGATILLVLQFGYVNFFPPTPLVKVRKFLNFATIPLIMVSAWALMQLRPRFRWVIVIAIIGISLYILKGFTYRTNWTPEMPGGSARDVYAYLKDAPAKPIYTDGRTINMLTVASGFELKRGRFHDYYEEKIPSPYILKDCYVVINTFYTRFDQGNLHTDVPNWVAGYPASIPPSWKEKRFLWASVYEAP